MKAFLLRYGFTNRNVYHVALGFTAGAGLYCHWSLIATGLLIFPVGLWMNNRENLA